MPRKILIIVFAAVGVLVGLRELSASGAPRSGNLNLWNDPGPSLNQKDWRKTTKRQSVPGLSMPTCPITPTPRIFCGAIEGLELKPCIG